MSNLVHGMMCVLLETGLVLFDMSDHCMYFCGKQQLTLTSGVLDCNSKEVLAQICLTPFSTIFQLYRGGQLYLWRKPDYPEKTTDLPQVIALTTHNFSYSQRIYEICCIQGKTEVLPVNGAIV
jgi:hypothetical protein